MKKIAAMLLVALACRQAVAELRIAWTDGTNVFGLSTNGSTTNSILPPQLVMTNDTRVLNFTGADVRIQSPTNDANPVSLNYLKSYVGQNIDLWFFTNAVISGVQLMSNSVPTFSDVTLVATNPAVGDYIFRFDSPTGLVQKIFAGGILIESVMRRTGNLSSTATVRWEGYIVTNNTPTNTVLPEFAETGEKIVLANTFPVTAQDVYAYAPSNRTMEATEVIRMRCKLIAASGNYGNIELKIGKDSLSDIHLSGLVAGSGSIGGGSGTPTNIVLWTNSVADASGLKGTAYATSLNGTNTISYGMVFSNAPTPFFSPASGPYQVSAQRLTMTPSNCSFQLMSSATPGLQTNGWAVDWCVLSDSPLMVDNLVTLPMNAAAVSNINAAESDPVFAAWKTNLVIVGATRTNAVASVTKAVWTTLLWPQSSGRFNLTNSLGMCDGTNINISIAGWYDFTSWSRVAVVGSGETIWLRLCVSPANWSSTNFIGVIETAYSASAGITPSIHGRAALSAGDHVFVQIYPNTANNANLTADDTYLGRAYFGAKLLP